jgi:L-aminopeptidase/D-esterase-like protein
MLDKNLLARVGLKLGHYTDLLNITGLSVFIAELGAHIGIDVRGSSSGTLNTGVYEAKSAGRLVHAVLLTGGSLFGLESAFGIMNHLEENGIGSSTRAGVVPLITGAVIFDLPVGNGKVRPTRENGYQAAKSASSSEYDQGCVGCGTGATVGKWAAGTPMKGGFGIGASMIDEILVAAFVVTNAVGDVVNPKTAEFYSECGKQELITRSVHPDYKRLNGLIASSMIAPSNTTLAVVATNMSLHKTQLMKVAELAHDGMARAIHPIHTSLDGDVIFALSSLSGQRKDVSYMSDLTCIDLVGLAASDAIVKAINNSVSYATAIEGFPSYK